VCSEHYVGALKTTGKQDFPIAVSGPAIETVITNLPERSQIYLMPETPEAYKALMLTRDIFAEGWESQMDCSVPQWTRLIRTMTTRASNAPVQVFDDAMEKPRLGTTQ
jgi:hypothetical protein